MMHDIIIYFKTGNIGTVSYHISAIKIVQDEIKHRSFVQFYVLVTNKEDIIQGEKKKIVIVTYCITIVSSHRPYDAEN